MKPRSLREMKSRIMAEINKPIPKNRIMSNEYDSWLNEQYEKEENRVDNVIIKYTVMGKEIEQAFDTSIIYSFSDSGTNIYENNCLFTCNKENDRKESKQWEQILALA